MQILENVVIDIINWTSMLADFIAISMELFLFFLGGGWGGWYLINGKIYSNYTIYRVKSSIFVQWDQVQEG